jgi:hypothetical protein
MHRYTYRRLWPTKDEANLPEFNCFLSFHFVSKTEGRPASRSFIPASFIVLHNMLNLPAFPRRGSITRNAFIAPGDLLLCWRKGSTIVRLGRALLILRQLSWEGARQSFASLVCFSSRSEEKVSFFLSFAPMIALRAPATRLQWYRR